MLSLVLPTYEESENISEALDSVARALLGFDFEILVVDDDSPDGTWEIAAKYAQLHPDLRVRVIRRRAQRGLSSAILDGWAQAEGDILGVMDADLSHDERILPELIGRIEDGADVAIGSRRIPGGGADRWPWYRKRMSDIATWMARRVLPQPISDPMSGYFLIRRDVLRHVEGTLAPRGYKILLEIIARASGGLRVEEVPFVFRDRRAGYSKLSTRVVTSYVAMLRDLRASQRPR